MDGASLAAMARLICKNGIDKKKGPSRRQMAGGLEP